MILFSFPGAGDGAYSSQLRVPSLVPGTHHPPIEEAQRHHDHGGRMGQAEGKAVASWAVSLCSASVHTQGRATVRGG